MMVRMIVAGLAAFVFSAPAQAATSKEKVETCAFGADELKLIGAKRKAYMAKCTANQELAARQARRNASWRAEAAIGDLVSADVR